VFLVPISLAYRKACVVGQGRLAAIYAAGQTSYLGFMDSDLTHRDAKSLLEWQIELGATEAICEAPINRFELEARPAKRSVPQTAENSERADAKSTVPTHAQDPVLVARSAAAAAQNLNSLQAAMAAFDLCDLKRGARQLVFADGIPDARVMIIGEAPGRDEDIQGRPFVGRAGQLLDKMLAAIGLDRAADTAANGVYITNVLPWRPPQNRDPEPGEIAMLLPFLQRHVALVQPEILVLMGNISCQAVLGRKGITRLRGEWAQGFDLPVMPMFHPAYLLRNPQAKRDAWADLLAIQARLNTATG